MVAAAERQRGGGHCASVRQHTNNKHFQGQILNHLLGGHLWGRLAKSFFLQEKVDHMKTDLELFSFQLTASEMQSLLDGIEEIRMPWWPWWLLDAKFWFNFQHSLNCRQLNPPKTGEIWIVKCHNANSWALNPTFWDESVPAIRVLRLCWRSGISKLRSLSGQIFVWRVILRWTSSQARLYGEERRRSHAQFADLVGKSR